MMCFRALNSLLLLWRLLLFLEQLAELNSKLCLPYYGSNTKMSIFLSLRWATWHMPHEWFRRSQPEFVHGSCDSPLILLSGIFFLTFQWARSPWILSSGSATQKDWRIFLISIFGALHQQDRNCSPLPPVLQFPETELLMWDCWVSGMLLCRLTLSPIEKYIRLLISPQLVGSRLWNPFKVYKF